MKLPALSKTYAGRKVLDLPELTLTDGAVHAVIGANGCGKSTFARILAGVIPADAGKLPPLGAGYMPQRSYPFHMKVLRSLRLTGAGREAARAQLEAFGLIHLEKQSAGRLSGGETARLALARLLLRDYPLLILDEPTAAMDVTATLLAEERILEYRSRTGCTVVLVTHSLTQARRMADEVLFLREGRLEERGSAREVLSHPRSPETRAFLDFYTL
ncbi:hypothetical protein B5G43_10815 [Flavonifractor sp. An92]|uniref:ATP-binding cassette domain-containing protein n=1 Tax=Flavonifractor sp. An92 TaxID=1965666 RepID=UPI000B37C91B|nr:ABC transporter ATP-binding protein [Flavonifractor sp. An92]OUN05910.1 hypothetical protein B5G43_10815 [Flavonifractor sp. An92]